MAIGLRGTTKYAVRLILEPEPGKTGDPKVLEAITKGGMTYEPVGHTAKMRIKVPEIQATSREEATNMAFDRVRKVIPENGYLLADPEPLEQELVPAAPAAVAAAR